MLPPYNIDCSEAQQISTTLPLWVGSTAHISPVCDWGSKAQVFKVQIEIEWKVYLSDS